jgi:hypothetical protein
MLFGTGRVWTLDIDIEGHLYYGWKQPRPRMSADDLALLHESLDEVSRLGRNPWYSALGDVRDTIYMDEHRANVLIFSDFHNHQTINALSGGDVPQSVELLLVKLADIYDKYAPVQ